jgi:beta-lactamase superfamily II metal-dependent hydrolase
MLMYVQQVEGDKDSPLRRATLDFTTLQDHLDLAGSLGGSTGDSRRGDAASMLSLEYVPVGYLGLKEGSWYEVNPEFFDGSQYQMVPEDAPGASYLRARLVASPSPRNMAQFLAKPRVAPVPAAALEMVVDPNPAGDIELSVVDCGHGNWNEIVTATDRVIYDTGASRTFTRAEVRALVAGRKISTEAKQISVVLSHWDIDHYHALLQFSASEFARLRVVFMPDQVPDTATFRRVWGLLNQHGVPLAPQQPAPRVGTTRGIFLHQHWQKGRFTMFRATPGRPRNQTGIVLGVRGPNGAALLTGDHHYEKVLQAAVDSNWCAGQTCVLVTPHHGGRAGQLAPTAWSKHFSGMATPISCGANSYRHPIAAVEAQLTIMQLGVQPWRTDHKGTWTSTL